MALVRLHDNNSSRRLMLMVAFTTLLLVSLACQAPVMGTGNKPGGVPTPTRTPTPTGIIPAVELSTPTPVGAKTGEVWTGTITSQTSRQYTNINTGAVLNTCTTNWSTNLTFLVDGSGGITGFGEAKLQSPVSCTPHPLSGNTTREVLKVEGQKDNGGFHLRLGVASFEPAVSADLGGFALLISESICPSVRRTLDIPITGANVAERGLTGQITMGCAGSARDVLSADSQIKLTLGFSCADIPSSEKETDAGKLCQ